MEKERGRVGKEMINRSEPQIVVVLGKVGAGKTSIAEEIAGRLGAPRLSSDVFRREKFGGAQFQPWHSDMAMWDMIDEAERLFASEAISVVMDATFSKRDYRDGVRDLALKYRKKLIWIEVRCEETKLTEDLADREENGTGNIDGDWVSRRVDDLEDIKERVVMDNSIRDRNKQEQIIKLVDKLVCFEE